MKGMTSSEIIVALGDTAAVAGALNLKLARVSNWKNRGIPWRFRPRVSDLARRNRVTLPPEFLKG
jgi:hypothetical protein